MYRVADACVYEFVREVHWPEKELLMQTITIIHLFASSKPGLEASCSPQFKRQRLHLQISML